MAELLISRPQATTKLQFSWRAPNIEIYLYPNIVVVLQSYFSSSHHGSTPPGSTPDKKNSTYQRTIHSCICCASSKVTFSICKLETVGHIIQLNSCNKVRQVLVAAHRNSIKIQSRPLRVQLLVVVIAANAKYSTAQGRFYQFHIIDEEIEAERSHLSNRARIQTLV